LLSGNAVLFHASVMAREGTEELLVFLDQRSNTFSFKKQHIFG